VSDDENNPSRRNNAPISPGARHCAACWTIEAF
jgi:hypothetical protein